MAHVFISYVREDSPTVQRLANELEAEGVEVWLDRSRLQPGERWQIAVRQAIRTGGFFLACFSSQYAAREKTYMNEELTIAIEELRQRPTNRAWFLPILLDQDSVPERPIGAGESLHDLEFVALHEDWKLGIERLLRAIRPAHSIDEPRATLRYRFHTEAEPLNHPAMIADRMAEQLKHIWTADPAPTITPDILAHWHRVLFSDVESTENIGRFRRLGEMSIYETWSECDGKPQSQLHQGIQADGSHRLWGEVQTTCANFDQSVAAVAQNSDVTRFEVVPPCARLYRRLLQIRPFPVNNDPVAYMALQAAYRRMRLAPLTYSPRPPLASTASERRAQNLAFNYAIASVLQPGAPIDSLVSFLLIHASFTKSGDGAHGSSS